MPALKINLYPREVQIIAMLAAGHTYHRIADELGLQYGTVKQYNHRLKHRLGIPYFDRQLATGIALELGLVSLQDVTENARLSPIWKEEKQ